MSLPFELYKHIFQFISSPREIINVYKTDDPILKNALSQSIKAVVSSNDILPLPMALDLSHVEVLNVKIPIEKPEDLLALATLPHLRQGVFDIPLKINNFEILEDFISAYCSGIYPLTQHQNKRTLLDKDLELRFPSVTFSFKGLNFYLETTTFKYPHTELFSLLGVYRTHTPLYMFDFSWVRHLIYKSIYQYLDNITKLKYLVIPFLDFDETGEDLIISKLITKVQGLFYRGNKKSVINRDFTYPSLPMSHSLKIFNLPTTMKSLHIILKKYPRVEEVLVMLDDVSYDEIDKFRSYRQLKRINLFLPPTSSISDINLEYEDLLIISRDQML